MGWQAQESSSGTRVVFISLPVDSLDDAQISRDLPTLERLNGRQINGRELVAEIQMGCPRIEWNIHTFLPKDTPTFA